MREQQSLIDYLPVDNDIKLRYRVVRPGSSYAASVLLLQGRAENLDKYAHVIADLVKRNLAVYTFDWRGQGLSSRLLDDRHKGHVPTFSDYLFDLECFVRQIWRPAQEPERRHYIIAHSMGAHIALRYLVESQLVFNGALFLAPMIDINTAPYPKWFAPILAKAAVICRLSHRYIPGQGRYDPEKQRYAGNVLTSDAIRFHILPQLIRENPELALGAPTFGWTRAAFESMAILSKAGYVESVQTPIYILVGNDDRVTNNEAARLLASRLPSCRFVVIENARHEIIMESDSILELFWQAVDEMVNNHQDPKAVA
jgi:lysophospholipase